MPSIFFSPVVGERVVVCVGPESEPSCVQTIHFTATFPSQQAYDEARRDRVRVELWTNIPTPENKNGTHWIALPFKERDTIPPEDDTAFPLVPETTSVKTLHLEIPVPRTGNSFTFTHRLSYPSGDIKWLGQYRHDGELVVERSDPRFTRGTFLDKDGEALVAGTNGWANKEIAQLSKTFDWSIHAIQEDGSSTTHALGRRALSIQAPAIFCVPIVRERSFVVPHTFSLVTSANSTFLVNTHGSVLMTGPAKCSVSFQSYGTEMQAKTRLAAIRKALSYSGAPRVQLLNLDSSLSHAILAAQEGSSSSTTVSVVPLITPTPSSSPRSVGVSVQSLATLVPRNTTDLALFCPSTQRSRFLAVPSDAKSDEDISLQAGTVCGQFVVASAYGLGSAGSSAWKVSITTAHTPVITSPNHLPSPPASPVFAPLSLPKVPAQSTSAKEVVIDEVEEKTEVPLPVAIPSALESIPFIPSTLIIRILLVKLWLLRVLMYFSAYRLPIKEAQAPVKVQKAQIEEPEAHQGEDEADDETVAPSVTSAADVATVSYMDDEDLKGSTTDVPALLFDVGAGDVSMLVRPTAETTSVSADAFKIDLDGVPVKRTVRALNDGIFLFEFSAGTTGGRLSVLSV